MYANNVEKLLILMANDFFFASRPRFTEQHSWPARGGVAAQYFSQPPYDWLAKWRQI